MQEIIIFLNFRKKLKLEKLKNSIGARGAYSNFYDMYDLFPTYQKRTTKLLPLFLLYLQMCFRNYLNPKFKFEGKINILFNELKLD